MTYPVGFLVVMVSLLEGPKQTQAARACHARVAGGVSSRGTLTRAALEGGFDSLTLAEGRASLRVRPRACANC